MQEKETGNPDPARTGVARNRVLSFPAFEPERNGISGGHSAEAVMSLLRAEDEWSHTIESVRIIGRQSVVVCSLLIEGQRRDGIGSCESRIEDSFVVAEKRALANAAMKFPPADAVPVSPPSLIAEDRVQASSLADLVSGSQLRRVRRLADSIGIDAEKASDRLFGCGVGELSREAASVLIETFESSSVRPADELKLAG